MLTQPQYLQMPLSNFIYSIIHYHSLMKQSYLLTHKLKSPNSTPFKSRLLLPESLKTKLPAIQPKYQQSDEKSLMLEIQNLDASLKNKNYRYFSGILFQAANYGSFDKIAQSLREALRHETLIVEDGFSVWGQTMQTEPQTNNHRDISVHEPRLSKKIETFNEKMVNLSFKNVYDYDLKKYLALMNKNKQRWSLFKRQTESITNLQNNMETRTPGSAKDNGLTHDKLTSRGKRNSTNTGLEVIDEAEKSHKFKGSPSKYTEPHESIKQSRISNLTKLTKASMPYTHSHSKLKKRSVTQAPQEKQSDSKQHSTISKYQLKSMLEKITIKNGQFLIVLWLPPASYPQFNGMLTYAVTKRQTTCRIKRYFFFRRTLTYRFFQAIMQQISSREDRFIEGLEMIIDKQQYGKVYQPIGWKLRSMESMNKVKIKLNRSNK